ncbi:MAG TPA: T9SS type A sorting domain-containing protein, partial [bacterium]|nr:T9SS type A sorting domain-containing protein [bacterium]
QSYSLTDTAAGAESLFIHLFQITPSAVTANAPQLLVDEAKLKTSGDTIAVSMPDCGATLFPDDHLELQRRDTSVNSGDRDADASSGPLQFELLQNYPNPFNPSTTIGLRLSASANLLIEIYNLAGTLQFTLFSGSLNPGLHLYCWEGKDETGHDSPSGIYFCRAFSNEQQVCNRKMLLLH